MFFKFDKNKPLKTLFEVIFNEKKSMILSLANQFNAAPKRIEPQKRAWSHLKDFKKSFQMKPSLIRLGAALD